MFPRDPDNPRRRRARSVTAVRAEARPMADAALRLDPTSGHDAAGLAHEAALIRAAIRRLAADDAPDGQVKTFAELRHQVDTLCTVLKTQQTLGGRGQDAIAAALGQALDELGDELGVPR